MERKVRFIKLIGLIAFMTVIMNWALVYSAEPVRVGSTLPALTLNAPDSPTARDYLGLEKGKKFTLSQVKANFFILEIFDVY